jgi:hypothetical protein
MNALGFFENTNDFRGIWRIHLTLTKLKPKVVNMKPIQLEKDYDHNQLCPKISPDTAQNTSLAVTSSNAVSGEDFEHNRSRS